MRGILGRFKRLSVIPRLAVLSAVFLLLGGGVYAGLGGFTDPPLPVNLSQGLVAHYEFDGNADDSSGNGYDGAVSNATLVSDRNGNTNSAYSFNGTTSRITYPTLPSLTGGELTISQWFKVTTATATPSSFSQGIPAGWSASLLILYVGDTASGTLGGIRVWWGTSRITYPVSVADDSWHHVVLKRSGSDLTLYLDGNQIGSSNAALGNWTSTSSSTGAANSNGSYTQFYRGELDDVRLYNRALNDDEIQYLYSGFGSGGTQRVQIADTQKGLVGHWKFDGDFKDSSPYGNNGTPAGNVVATGQDRKGQASKAAVFDGNGDYIVHSTTGIDPRSGSVAVWVNPAVQDSWGIWQTHNVSSQNWVDWITMFAYSSGLTYLRMGNGIACCSNDVTFNTAAQIPPNQWTHLAFTWSDSILESYVNGVRVAYRNSPTLQDVMDPLARIGWGHNAGMNGLMDDFRIYNRALTSAEINQLVETYDANISISSLQKDLVGHWSMDGGGKDVTPYGNNATVAGATLTSDRRGRQNSAYNFNGTDNYLSIPHGSSTSLTTFSISGWFKTTDKSKYTAIVSKNTSSINRNYWISIWPEGVGGPMPGSLVFRASSDGVGTSIGSAVDYADGQWHHFVVTFSAPNVSLYVNGELANSSGGMGVPHTPNTPLVIGNDASVGGRFFNGQIDDVRIYKRVLTAAEAKMLYDNY